MTRPGAPTSDSPSGERDRHRRLPLARVAPHQPHPEREATLRMTLLADLDAFYLEHERCGDLDSGLDGDRVWMTCTCGAVINRSADEIDQRGRLLLRGNR